VTAERFAGRVAFITGGAIGFGRAFARALAAEGAAIVIADINGAAAEAFTSELAAAGTEALALTCDVADEDQVDRAVESTVERFGGVDILINNAGKHLMKYNRPITKLERKEVREIFDVNVMGVVNCSASVRPAMAERGGGVMVNIASISSNVSSNAYGVSKLAVRGLTIAFATEFAADQIRVNAISPGIIATENALDDLPSELIEEYVQQHQLVRRLGQMDDIVSALLFLCSDEATFITGETLRVSGGYPLHM
jgi:NAD(P)-dependent dehydrogenase (short-subunit alcohol dehydrogenase family)